MVEADLKLDRAECVNLLATSVFLVKTSLAGFNGHPPLAAPLLKVLQVFATGPICAFGQFFNFLI